MQKHNLERFISAQKNTYGTALSEIKNGEKQSHWMWFIFPQIKGLGQSPIAVHYAIQSKEEAIAYLNDSTLGKNLIEISEALLALEETDAEKIFGYIDAMKLKSSMTLFALVSDDDSIFHKILERYYNGEMDELTAQILNTKG